MKRLTAGILAHVDAGKTTLSESMLYLSGAIRKLGRVDNQDTFLDNYELERARGITIFSKQARIHLGDTELTFLDTPGHVDFSAEMERTLQVLDYAVLVISGADGVQGHTQTVWKLLERYQIPVFLFINKMDQNGTDRARVLAELKNRLSGNCVDFTTDQALDEWIENVAVCDEAAMEWYLEKGSLPENTIAELVFERKVFPCYFGSALKLTGVQEFLEGLEKYTREPSYGQEFAARVYKIARDDQGNRLTYVKITGGVLKVKDLLSGLKKESLTDEEGELWEEKVNQIRVYAGARYETVNEAQAGMVCALTGLNYTSPGEGLGAEKETRMPMLEPVLSYQICLPEGCDVHKMLKNLKMLEEEEPELHIVWDEHLGEIHAKLMGEVQTEILKSLIKERFGVEISFGSGSIVYKETIQEPVEGVGHFEPLRHYAEVHLWMEPAPAGSGLTFATSCSEDVLDRNWQRLILTHLGEREHPGVLTGSAITDMKITLAAGRAHQKHTEGGDFRQATYRAVRQGLKKARCVLLEPWYDFRLELPADCIGRAMSDVQQMQGRFDLPVTEGDTAVLTGSAPVACMREYQSQVVSYTRGMGRLTCTVRGYEPCHNAAEVEEAIGYDSEKDLENPTGSVFCAHGVGFSVPWYRVEDYMHLQLDLGEEELEELDEPEEAAVSRKTAGVVYDEKELEEIFTRTYGPIRRNLPQGGTSLGREKKAPAKETEYKRPKTGSKPAEEYLLVDGYNIIFAWEELNELSKTTIDGARSKLMDILCDYQGYRKCTLILVFDAYKVQGHREEILRYHNIYVVYTKEAETADQYIEKTAHAIGRKASVTVATSDSLEQVIILGQGCRRLSARGLKEEIEQSRKELRSSYLEEQPKGKSYLLEHLDQETADYMEKIRRGEIEKPEEKNRNLTKERDRKK